MRGGIRGEEDLSGYYVLCPMNKFMRYCTSSTDLVCWYPWGGAWALEVVFYVLLLVCS